MSPLMLRTVIAVAAFVLGIASSAMAGETVVGKGAPTTDIQLVKETPERVYFLRGPIEWDADQKFKKLAGDATGGWLFLDSPGGDLEAAIAVGRLVSARKIKTYVPDGIRCYSACAIVWMGGLERWIGHYATVGFHRPWRLENGQEVDATSPSLIQYFKTHGATDKAMPYLLTPSDQLYYLTPKNTAELGIEAKFTRSQ